MNEIKLQALPNQQFNTVIGGDNYDFRIVATGGVMSCTIVKNSVTLLDNVRCTAGTFLLPYKYQETGNFIITNLNDELIDYTKFGSSQRLFYLSPDDLANVRS